MWREVLRIFPRLDAAATRIMENTLNRRFANVARRFGQGLQKVVRFTALGAGLAIVTRLLNPLQAMEERIRNMLGQAEDLNELADRFNTTPGQLRRLQAIGEALGVRPERLNELMSRYAEAIENARLELTDPNAQKSNATRILKEFVDEKDLAEGFFKFLQSLRAQGESSGIETRQRTEREIFGSVQHGAARRLIEADFASEFDRAGIPTAGRLNQAIEKMAALAELDNRRRAGREANELISTAGRMNEKMIEDIARAEQRRIERENQQLESFKDLKRASEGIDEIIAMFTELMKLLTRGVGMLGELVPVIKNSRLIRGIFGTGGN